MSTGSSATTKSAPARSWLPKLPLLPAALFLMIFFALPVGRLLLGSLSTKTADLSLDNYAQLFGTNLYIDVLVTTFRLAAWTTLICLVVGYPVAYLLSGLSQNVRNRLLIIILLPFWTSILIRAFAWILILGRKGIVNQSAMALGFIDTPLDLMYNFWAVVIGTSHAMMPLAVLTMFSVMINIDPRLGRAASTLGARDAHVFWRIYFPLSLPGVAAAGLLTFVSSIGFFITPVLLGSPRQLVISQLILFHMEETLNWGLAGAISVFLLAVTIVIFMVFNRFIGMASLFGQARLPASKPGARRRNGVWGRNVLAALGWIFATIDIGIKRILPRRQGPKDGSSRPVIWLFTILVAIFLAVPAFFLVPVSFSSSQFIEWPPQGFSTRWYEEYWNSVVWKQATIRSIWVGACTAILSLIFGIPAAFVLARQSIPGKSLLMIFILLPMVLPHIIVAVGLFYLYDIRLDQAAWTLGAGPFRTFFRVTLPIVLAGVLTSFIFAFVKSFDELTVALFVAAGTSATLPRQLWSEALFNTSPLLAAVSTVVLVFITIIILVTEFIGKKYSSR